MKIIMLQEKLKKNFEYKIYDEETNKQIYVAKANRIIGFGYRRIELLSYDNFFWLSKKI